jgi:hypothetical protein
VHRRPVRYGDNIMTGVPVEWRRENELPLLSAYYDSLIGAGKADPAVFVSTVLHEHPVPPMAPTASVRFNKVNSPMCPASLVGGLLLY